MIFFIFLIWFFLGLLLDMVGYGGELDYHDQPRSIKTKQDQPRSNQDQINENQSLALIALALLKIYTRGDLPLWDSCFFGSPYSLKNV